MVGYNNAANKNVRNTFRKYDELVDNLVRYQKIKRCISCDVKLGENFCKN